MAQWTHVGVLVLFEAEASWHCRLLYKCIYMNWQKENVWCRYFYINIILFWCDINLQLHSDCHEVHIHFRWINFSENCEILCRLCKQTGQEQSLSSSRKLASNLSGFWLCSFLHVVLLPVISLCVKKMDGLNMSVLKSLVGAMCRQ